eukprot:6197694-Pleurochrysis_carterae.AAC.1
MCQPATRVMCQEGAKNVCSHAGRCSECSCHVADRVVFYTFPHECVRDGAAGKPREVYAAEPVPHRDQVALCRRLRLRLVRAHSHA